jgi:hypothetical protein
MHGIFNRGQLGLRGYPGDSDCQRANRAKPASATRGGRRRSALAITPTWRRGDQARWKDRPGVFRRDVGDGEHAEVTIGERVYRVRITELA